MVAPGGLGLAVRAGSEEAQRRPGQGQRARGGVLDGDLQALRLDLVPGVDLVQGAHLARGDAGLGQPVEQLGGVDVGEGPLQQLDDLLAPGDPLAVGGEAGGVGVQPELGAQPPPQPLAAAGQLHAAAAGAVEQAVGGDGGVVVALPAGHLPAHGVRRPLVGVHADDGGQQRRAHHLAAAGALALEQRGQHAVRAVHAGQQVADRDADLLRVLGAGPGHRHQAGLALGDLVVAGPAALGAVVPEPGDRQGDQPRVELGQHVGAEAEPVQGAGAEVLHEHVGPAQQLGEHRLVGVVLEVEGDRLLVPVGGEEVGRLPPAVGGVDERRAPAAAVVTAARRLHLHDPRAEVAEHHPGVRAGQGAGEVDDEDAVQWSAHEVPLLHRRRPGRARGDRRIAGQTTVSVTHR